MLSPFLFLAAGVGICFVVVAIHAFTKTGVARTWPTTAGHIISVNTREVWLGRGALYFPVVRYRYRVGPDELAGTRLGFGARGPWFSRDAALYSLRRDYAPGREVVVSYDPKRAHVSVLEPCVGASVRALLAIGVLLVIAPAVAAILL